MKYNNVYNRTFSGTDMVVSIVFPKSKPIIIGQSSTVSYSIYRETHPVRTIGKINPQAFTKGPRTIAGTMIFTVFDKHIVNVIRQQVSYLKSMVKLKVCELPLFDLYITMGNEYGATARLNIYGVTIVDEGMVMSIEDLFTENQWSYMAKDILLLDDINSEQNLPITDFYHGDVVPTFKAKDLVMDDVHDKMLNDIKNMIAEQKAEVEAARKRAIEEAKKQAELIKKEIAEAIAADKKKKEEQAKKDKENNTINSPGGTQTGTGIRPSTGIHQKYPKPPGGATVTINFKPSDISVAQFDPGGIRYGMSGDLKPSLEKNHCRVIVTTYHTHFSFSSHAICDVHFSLELIDAKTNKSLCKINDISTGSKGGCAIAINNYMKANPRPKIKILLKDKYGVGVHSGKNHKLTSPQSSTIDGYHLDQNAPNKNVAHVCFEYY